MGFFGGVASRVPYYTGHQCERLINDMVYASAGANFDVAFAEERLVEWLNYRAVTDRTRERVSLGYCADQWAMHMLLGHWSNGTCRMLSECYYTFGLPWNEPAKPE